MITRIEAKNYRSFKNVGIDLPQYAVLVGANGAGKTTFLDIPRLIGDCLKQEHLANAFLQRQSNRVARCSSLSEIVFRSRAEEFILALEATLPKSIVMQLIDGLPPSLKKVKKRWPTTIRYELLLRVTNHINIHVKGENLFLIPANHQVKQNNARLRWGDSPRYRPPIIQRGNGEARFRSETKPKAKARPVGIESSRLALPRVLYESKGDFPAAIWFCNLLMREYIFYQPDLAALQMASPPGLSKTLLPDASNLPHLALKLYKNDSQLFKHWQDHVKFALPNIDKIELKVREEDHHVYVRIHYQGGYAITSSGLSEGTLRFLALTLLPYLDDLPSIVFLEELENGIHPQAIELVLQSLSSAYNSQMLIGSHSPVVLANSKRDQLLCFRLCKEGATTVVSGNDHPRLNNWKEAIDLGMLFASGVLE